MASWFSTLKTDPYGTLNPEQVNLNKNLGPDLTNRATGDYSQFLDPNQLTAPITQGEQNVVGNNSRMNAIANNTFGQIGQYDPQSINDNFDKYVQKPTLDNWMQNEAPYLREQLNGFSSEQGNVLARALNTQQNNLAQQRMGYQQQAQVNALNALGGANTYNQGSAQIQSIPRTIQQAGLTNDYNNFLQANNQKKDSIDQALQFLGLSTGKSTSEPTTFGNLLSAGQAAGNIYSSFTGGGGNSNTTNVPQYSGGGFSNVAPFNGGPSSSQLSSDPNQWKLMSLAGA